VSAGNKNYFTFSTDIRLCEAGLSTLTIFKTKHRNQLQPEDDIGCVL